MTLPFLLQFARSCTNRNYRFIRYASWQSPQVRDTARICALSASKSFGSALISFFAFGFERGCLALEIGPVLQMVRFASVGR